MSVKSSKKVKYLVIYPVYLIFCIIVGLFVVEGLIRLLGLAPTPPSEYSGYVEDPYVPFRPRPFFVSKGRSASGEYSFEYRYNSVGFRDVEHEIEKPRGVFRIFGLGDSFTLGAGADFEQSYLYRLEKMLNEREGDHPRVEIIKAGISNYGAIEERLLLKHYGVKYKPDLITVGFVPNDVIGCYFGANYFRVVKLGYLMTDEADRLGDFGTWLYFHSHLSRIFLRKVVAGRIQKKTPYKYAEVFKADGFHEKDWRKLESEYEKMAAIARSIDAKFVIIHIPQGYLDKEMCAYPASRLARLAERIGAVLVDTLPALREAAKKETVYWKKDGHCTPAGYRVIAETIYARLAEANLVP